MPDKQPHEDILAIRDLMPHLQKREDQQVAEIELPASERSDGLIITDENGHPIGQKFPIIESVVVEHPDQHWMSGDFQHPDLLVQALKGQEGLDDYEDANGNMQGRVRLDYDPNGGQGFWVTCPSDTDPSIINVVDRYEELVAEREAEQSAQKTA